MSMRVKASEDAKCNARASGRKSATKERGGREGPKYELSPSSSLPQLQVLMPLQRYPWQPGPGKPRHVASNQKRTLDDS